ncbi:MAG: cytochrome ubiquinol oxidase subunit I [Gammaproteobacteria bacterium]|nr:cytochrome ubiquinol oxidase subunit I [Gammaproteobacteria bacterium]
MEFDPLTLARIQFTLNISFHILFPTITIGLAWILLYFRIRFTTSQNRAWEYAYHFWVKIFALTFALGVVSGITMSFQFGTNWPGFIEKTGNIAGPLLGYEVLTAFFLEATFLGIMLFGKDRVSNRVHLIATALVAIGTALSAFWILSLNSWMQTPQGYSIVDGKFFVESWMAIIFNPSFPYRLTHMLLASLLTSAFLIAGVSAWRFIRGVDGPATLLVLKTGIVMAAILAPLQIFTGDLHGLNTLEHQPAKIAAMEGIWQTEEGAPFTLFGFPDEARKKTHYAIEIPKASSLILTHELNGEVMGLNEFENEHPPVAIVFWSFRIMLAVGTLMVLISWWGLWSIVKKSSLSKPVLSALMLMTFSGWVATLAGWYVTEVGRQPWIVYGLLRTSDVVAQHPAITLVGTVIAYALLYVFLLVSYMGTLRYMASKPAESLALLQAQSPAQSGRPQGGV